MSLFSRLDRLRTRDSQESAAENENGLFSVPDLSAPQNANVPPAPGQTNASPADDVATDKPQFAPVDLDAAPETVQSENEKPSMFAATPFKLPKLSEIAENAPDESATPDPEDAQATNAEFAVPAPDFAPPAENASVLPAAPPENVASAEAPAAKANLSPFERLMAARAAQSPVSEPRSTPAPSEVSAPENSQHEIPDEATSFDAVPAEESAPEAEDSSVPIEVSEAETSNVETPEIAAPEMENEASEPETQTAEMEMTAPQTAPIEAPSAQIEEAPEARQTMTQTPAPKAVPSLADRLATAPREELQKAHAEAEALAPGILDDAPAPHDAPLAVAAPTAPPAKIAAPPEKQRPAARSFSERLAARTGLDSQLHMPAEAPAPAQQLATSHTELARINDGGELSQRETKNRVLFRQKHLIFDSVIGSLDQRALQNPTAAAIKPAIEHGVDGAIREFNLDLDPFERNWMVEEFVRETTDLGPLVSLLEDPAVNKIIVTGANDVSVERLGRAERTGVAFRDDDHLLSLVRRMAEMSGGRIDAKVPLLDRPLPDGARIRAKVPPLAPQPTLTIEKSSGNPFVALKRQQVEKARGETLPYAQLRERIQQRLLREFEGDAAALAGDPDKLRGQVEEMIGAVIAEERVAVSRAERASLVMDLLNEIVGLGPIEPLLNDPDIDEVMVNGPYQIYVERKGKLELTSQRFRDNAHVMQVIDRIVAPLGRRVDEKSPMVDGRLRDGSRFNAIIPPLALSGPTMTIRKFARDPFTMSDLINFGTISREAAQFLQAAVEGRLNIVVSGGTGSGKTTTLNVLSSFIPSTERIVTIEDAAELQMRQEHVIRMETRPPNIEGVGEVGIRDLVKNSLRMRPDRIVVGECRGGEALDMLQAMNTGHDGSLTTAHSNGPRDTLKRLETMVMMAGFDLPVRAIREQISMAVQLIVHQERMRDGKRRVTAVTELVGMEGDVVTMQDIFRFEQDRIDEDGRIHGKLAATGMRPKYFETIIDNGAQLSMDLFHPRAPEEGARARLTERTTSR